jgi:hypothetical protein
MKKLSKEIINQIFLSRLARYLKTQESKGYKKIWVYYKLIEKHKLLRIELCLLSVALDYSLNWAYYEIQKLYPNTTSHQVIESLIEKQHDPWKIF